MYPSEFFHGMPSTTTIVLSSSRQCVPCSVHSSAPFTHISSRNSSAIVSQEGLLSQSKDSGSRTPSGPMLPTVDWGQYTDTRKGVEAGGQGSHLPLRYIARPCPNPSKKRIRTSSSSPFFVPCEAGSNLSYEIYLG